MKKHFFRTVWGKAVLTVVFVLSMLIFAACAAGAGMMLSAEDGYLYLRTEEEAKERQVKIPLRSRAEHVLEALLNTNDKDAVLNGSRDLIYRVNYPYTRLCSEGAEAYDHWEYSFEFAGISRSGSRIDVAPVFFDGQYKGYIHYTIDVGPKQEDSWVVMTERFIHYACTLRWWVFAIAAAALVLAVSSFVSLMKVSARRSGREELVPGPLNKVPYDLMLAFGAAALIGIASFIDWILPIDYSAELLMVIGAGVLGLLILIGLSMSAAARIKHRTLIRGTLIYKILRLLLGKPLEWLWKGLKKLHAFNMTILRNLPFVWKTAIFMGILAVLALLTAVAAESEEMFFLGLIKYLILIPIVLYFAVCLRRLQKGGETLAAGDLSYQTETKGLPWDLKKHAQNLNSIADGMTAAVKEQMKSERMKTELITNVSHDLKTPLTSLVNYAGLIAKEPSENPKITEYAEVLVRQSDRLKRLIDDLVEASKASTGDLDVDLVPCDARVLLQQAAGEYEERLAAAGLTLVTRQPEKEVRIMADSRRMWRIFDNLMNNIVKYALSGTRVYLDLAADGENAVITFRNTSREPLEMNAQELTERFTRGDLSRNTEGSGLGLAIAKSLTELQGGKLSVTADGDLFKVVLRFPSASV